MSQNLRYERTEAVLKTKVFFEHFRVIQANMSVTARHASAGTVYTIK